MPKKTSKRKAPKLTKTEKWYKEQTGLSPKRGAFRIEKIKAYLKSKNLSLNDVKIEQHIDPEWNERRNRTKKEKKAKMIGYTNTGKYASSRYWIVPK
jgi:hypothetical protein